MSLTKRVIARLDVKGSKLIKGISFEGLRVIGNAKEMAYQYSQQRIDEIFYTDAVASLYGRNSLAELLKSTCEDVFVPITAGGAIKNLEDGKKLLYAGADKLAINTGIVQNPELINKLSSAFGKQCVVASLQVRRSLTNNSWNLFLNTNNPSQNDIDDCYMNLVRNVKRNYWFIAFNFGGSPCFHESFIDKRGLGKEIVDSRFHDLKNACSLRMSDVGYQSNLQKNIDVNYNSLNKYVESIIGAINMPNDIFEKISEFDNDGYPQQISSGTLQIENELYDVIRPKRRGESGERPANLLKKHGIEYVEFRGLDINPFEVTGISKAQIHLMDIFLLYCLMTPSPKILPEEAQINGKNSIVVIEEGRNKNAEIFFEGNIHKITDAVDIIFSRLILIARELGGESAKSLDTYIQNKGNDQALPEIIMKELQDSEKDFHEYNLDNSLDIAKKEIKLDGFLQKEFENQAYQSIKEQETLETENKIDIISFINDFNSKLK